MSNYCRVCPECHPGQNPCDACMAGGICDGFAGRGCVCSNSDDYEPEGLARYDATEDDEVTEP